jgi:uncharacterized protein
VTAFFRLVLACLLLACGAAAGAQTFPTYNDSGVVDAAGLLDPAQEAALSQKLIAQKKASGRSLVVATVPDLEGYDISDYGYRLGRAWNIGQKDEDDGIVLIVAPNDRKVWIATGYGIEGIVTDALASRIVRNDITPRFKAGDMAGGITAGVDALSTLLALPPDEARKQAALAEQEQRGKGRGGGNAMLIFWIIVIFVIVVLPMISGGRRGRRYRSGRGPVVIWGPGVGGGWGGGDWGGGGSSGGGFSGGVGFGGGGAGGSW